MKNRRALFSIVTTLSIFTLATLVACEDDPKSEFDGGSDKPDANFDTGAGFNTDSGKEKDADVSCKAQLPTTFAAPTIKAPTVQQVCENQELGEYFANCIATDATGDAKTKSKDCTDWRAAHDACAKCIEPEDNTGPVMLFRDRLYYLYNFAGCIGIVQKNTAKDSCADTFNLVEACRQAACDSCFDKEGVNSEDLRTCRSAALTDDCAKYKNTRDTTCGQTGYLDAGSSLSAVNCLAQKADEAEGNVFTRLAKFFCGKP